MIKVYIVSGFLGSGKTTFVKKLLNSDNMSKVMLIENEFGEIGIDGNLFNDKIQIKEINSGCICCSLKGDLKDALEDIKQYDIENLIIEPSGVGKLSEIISTVINDKDMELASHLCMVDAKKAKSYHKNFKEFFDDQVIASNVIILSKTEGMDDNKLNETVELLKELNDEVKIVTTPYLDLDNEYLLSVISENVCQCEECLGCFKDHEELEEICGCHHYDDDEKCDHHHKHHHEGCDCHEHHEHHEECGCHNDEHHHDCGCHDHHHDADEVFENIGIETIKTFSYESLKDILETLKEDDVIRAKGFVRSDEDKWLYFDISGDDIIIKEGEKKYTGLVVVIGSELNKEKIEGLFKL